VACGLDDLTGCVLLLLLLWWWWWCARTPSQYDPAVKRDKYTIHGDEIR
jgi:hypothetical protein